MSRQSQIHNAAVGQIIRMMTVPILTSGGTSRDIMVLTESVLVGIALLIVRLGGDELVLDTLCTGAKERLAQIRLEDAEPKGRA